MKKITLIFGTFFFLFSVAIAQTKVQIGDMYYSLDEENLTAETATMPNIVVDGNEVTPRYSFSTFTVPSTVDYGGKTYSVIKIGDGSMRDNPNLTTFTIPASVKTIGNSAFASCSNLITVSGSQNASSVEDWAFYGCEKMTFFIPSPDLKAITEHCFQYCSSLGAFNIPVGVTEIRTCAFQDASKLANVTIPAGVTVISPWSFYGTAIKSITIPEGVTKLAGWTFGNCYSLETIKLPASLIDSEDWVFDKASSIKEVYVAWPTPPDPNNPEAEIQGVKWWTFGDAPRTDAVVKVPSQYAEAYGETWFDFKVESYSTGIKATSLENGKIWFAEGSLNFENLNGYKVTVYSPSGTVVANFNVRGAKEQVATTYAKGIYIVKAKKGDSIISAKLIVK
jgi:hypothetical protein